jgi:transcriptional regulator NrdR family protein
MSRLAELDQVAYVRFASVYRDFTGVKDFERFIARLEERQGEEVAAPGPDADVAAK